MEYFSDKKFSSLDTPRIHLEGWGCSTPCKDQLMYDAANKSTHRAHQGLGSSDGWPSTPRIHWWITSDKYVAIRSILMKITFYSVYDTHLTLLYIIFSCILIASLHFHYRICPTISCNRYMYHWYWCLNYII